jgi:hypothetical protein
VIGIAVLAIVLGMDRRFDGWALGARAQTIAPRVRSRQPRQALAWHSSDAVTSRRAIALTRHESGQPRWGTGPLARYRLAPHRLESTFGRQSMSSGTRAGRIAKGLVQTTTWVRPQSCARLGGPGVASSPSCPSRSLARVVLLVQTNSVVECRRRGWSRGRSGSRRAPAARSAVDCWFHQFGPCLRRGSGGRLCPRPATSRNGALIETEAA